MSEPALALRDVTRIFRRRCGTTRALDGVSLEVMPGEIAGLVGPNGAGKTTLLRIAAGALRPTAGTVAVEGAAAGSAAARRALGFAPDAPVFPPALTVREVLEYLARFHLPAAAGWRARAAARRDLVGRAIELGGLEEVAARRVAALSLGYARRLALAQAALGGRRLLLLDETLAAVDPVERRALGDRLQRLAAGGVAVVLSSHDLATVERLAARAVVLAGGRIVRTAPLAVLLRERVLEIVLDRPAAVVPTGFRPTATGLETELGDGTAEAALAVCRAHRLTVRATRVRLKSLEDVVLDAARGAPR